MSETVNIITLAPLLSGAIDRHGEIVAELCEQKNGREMAIVALEHTGSAFAFLDSDEKQKKLRAARILEEAATMGLVAAHKLRKDAGQ